MKEGISVTTIGLGLGYHEDLMERLAKSSDGNHLFVEAASELASVFKEEFGDVLSVVAQGVTVDIRFAPGVHPVRVLGRDADIVGDRVTARLNQVYGGQEKYVLVEVEIEPGGEEGSRAVAEVGVEYDNMGTESVGRLRRSVEARFSSDRALVDGSVDKDVMVALVTQEATMRNRRAVELRDEGQVVAAKQLLESNSSYLRQNADLWQSKQLSSYAQANGYDAQTVDDEKEWSRTRKGMRAYQLSNEQQQRLIPNYGQQQGVTGAVEQRAED
jgi:Ca-activated chloride channel family protein